jgi:hypothetical protein
MQGGVATTSNTLADVAKGIAEDEYGDYPDIQLPILEAAKGMLKHLCAYYSPEL